MAKKVTINGSNLLSSTQDAWGGQNTTQYSQNIHGTTVPPGAEWGMNRGEVERFIKSSINAQQSRVGYYVCDNSASTGAKAVVASGYQLAIGGCVRIKMTNVNTANNVTLNINSTGAKALYYDGAQASSTNTWEAGEVLEVYYDGTQYQCASGGGGKFATGEKVRETGITNSIGTGSDDSLLTKEALLGVLYGNGTTEETIEPTQIVMSGNNRLQINYINSVKNGDLLSYTCASGYEISAFITNSSGTSAEEQLTGGYQSTFNGVYNSGDGRYVRMLVKKSNNGNFTKDEALSNITYSIKREVRGGAGILADIDTLYDRTGYFACSTAANIADKVVSAEGFILSSGGNIRIKMSNANTANSVTLNINGTGAKALYYNGMPVSAENTWEAGEVLVVYYDGVQYQCAAGDSAKTIKFNNVSSHLKGTDLQTALDDVGNTIFALNDTRIAAGTSTGGYYTYENGVIGIGSSNAYRYWPPVDISSYYAVKLKFYLSPDAATARTFFTDENDIMVGDFLSNTTGDYVTYVIPKGAKKLYWCTNYSQQNDVVIYGVNRTEKSKEISILFIGNSLTQDAVSYVPLLLKELAPTVNFKFYIWYNGGYNLTQQLADFNNNVPCDIFSVCESGTRWQNFDNNTTMQTVLSTYQFDIVCLQEYFNIQEKADVNAFNGIIEYIENNYSHPFKVITFFHAPQRSTSETVFNRTKVGNALLLKETVAEDMIAAGIAIYRALSTSLDSLGDHGHLSPDDRHAQEGLPCMLEAYVTAMWILKQVGVSMSVNNSSTIVDNSNYNSINVPGPNLGTGVVIGTTDQVRLSQKVAVKAFKEGEYFVNANLTEYTT